MDNYLWDLVQQRRVGELKKDASAAKRRAREKTQEVRDLGQRFEQLAMVTEAMWELCRDQLGLTEEQLAKKVEDIDLRDGKSDGKNKKVKVCNACNRKYNPSRDTCLWCGSSEDSESAFDKV